MLNTITKQSNRNSLLMELLKKPNQTKSSIALKKFPQSVLVSVAAVRVTGASGKMQ